MEREGGMEGGREGWREGGREGGREGKRERITHRSYNLHMYKVVLHTHNTCTLHTVVQYSYIYVYMYINEHVHVYVYIHTMYMYSVYIYMYVSYFGLEGTPKSHYKRILGKGENVSLVKHLLHLFLHDHTMLANLLHSKPLTRALVAYQIHSTRGGEGGGGTLGYIHE